MVASFWYLVLTSVLTVGQYYLERHFARGRPAGASAHAPRSGCDAGSDGPTRPGPDACRSSGPARARAGRADPMTASLMVQAEGVRKRYGHFDALQGIDLEVAPGEVCCLIGPSGSGKSTFLRCINHLEKIDAGRLSVDGELVGYREHAGRLYELRDKEVCAKRAEIGMVFQRFNLFPH